MSDETKLNRIRLHVKDRKLGSEWSEWDGCIDEKEIDFDSRKRLFIGFTILAQLIFSGVAVLFWYLIQPRIIQLSTMLATVLSVIVLGGIVLFFSWVFLNILSIVFGKNLLLRIFRFEFSLTFLAPMVLRLGDRFGISKDQMSNSFIKVSNSLTKLSKNKFHTSNLLVLLPHCLQRNIRQKLLDLGDKYKIGIFTASGGSIARKIIARQRPSAVVAVACERDLILGIKDIFMKIPVLGIPNRRPEGPCKNTTVDFEEVENAIRFFLNLK
jgi:hypothetical protein